MKKLPVFLLTLTILLPALMNAANGQTQMPRNLNQHKYVHLIKLMDGIQEAGWIIKMDSLQIELLVQNSPEYIRKISQHEIKSIKIHKRGAGGRGVLIGAIAGGLLGGLIGVTAYSSPPAPNYPIGPAIQNFGYAIVYAMADTAGELNALAGGVGFGMLGGGLIGGIIGSETYVKKFEINGDPIAFEKARIAFSEFENHNSPL